ncbi:MAG: M24 family metallopeptidase, partial [Lachnospiraceae bacterium]|nr:M24 family metallopeptidase [Lachnospiraceae bacterium]
MIKERINALRALMKRENIDIYVVPTSDYHNSEYVGVHFKCREFLSGFTGSNGTLVVTADGAYLWTDGRYFLQAAEELKGSDIELMKMLEEGVPTIPEFLNDHLTSSSVLGFDGRVFSVGEGQEFEEVTKKTGSSIRFDVDLCAEVWTGRPALSAEPVFVLETKYAGLEASEKLAAIRAEMEKKDCTHHIVTSLDDIAWILNMRGADVDCNPVFLSYLLIGKDDAVLFANPDIMTAAKAHLESLNIRLLPYNDIYSYIGKLPSDAKVMIDKNRLNYALYSTLSAHCETCITANPSTLMKSKKNETERENLREANIIDGVAMVRFLRWLDENIGKIKITEVSAAKKLEQFRSEGRGYKGLSFDTISGYNAHGAIIHYEPTEATDIEVEPHGLLLVDSGAQYLSGTTDITRTIAVGPMTPEMKHHYTMVLRGHLNLAAAIFKEGCSGANLDILARAPFWDEYEDYNHGTGHGIGFFLNVHEGPQSFHWNSGRRSTLTKLEEGMVITDEPGIYIEGKYGVRIENDLLCVKDKKSEYGQFMRFETLTLCPIDLRPVNFEELTAKELKTLK